MKTDSPYDRGDIHINKNDKVLEIGPGHNPTYRSNVIAEKFIDTNYHRCGDVKIYPHQTFYMPMEKNCHSKTRSLTT